MRKKKQIVALGFKCKQWWKGGFTEYRIFVGSKADVRYLRSLGYDNRHKIVRIKLKELPLPKSSLPRPTHAEGEEGKSL